MGSPLRPHPSTLSAHVRSLNVDAQSMPGAVLLLRYVLEGDIERLKVPEPGRGARTDGLWQHTCFELFLKRPGTARYLEFNFAPSGDWAAYRFDDYRQGMRPLEPVASPAIACRHDRTHLKLEVSLNPDGLHEEVRGLLHVALAAVIEDDAGALSYWALRHPAGNPDFHSPDGFLLNTSWTQ